uniref:Mab-21 domain-containing protein n=1 Tax=Dracunculus medinensis TaxID=318479 RepID=A0A0N4U8G0_DRAME
LRSGTKQLRYLESADLKLEKITVKPFVSVENDDMPMLRNVIVELKRLIPIKLFKKKCFHDFLLDYSVEQRRILRNIYKQIEESHMVGSAIDEIVVVLDKSKVYWALDELENATQIIRVGIDCIRFVLDIFSESWIVYSGDFAFFPAPWSTSSGDVDVSTVRWMAEGILCSIVNRPGIAMNDLKLKYSFALQPRFFMDLIKLLERFGCIVLKQIRSIPANLNSPFLDEGILHLFFKIIFLIFYCFLQLFYNFSKRLF